MRTGISISITRSDRDRLWAITRDRNAAQKHVWRAAIVLLSADGIGTDHAADPNIRDLCQGAGRSGSCRRASTAF
jgi:hypothetical protein